MAELFTKISMAYLSFFPSNNPKSKHTAKQKFAQFFGSIHRKRKQNPDLCRMDPEAARTARDSLELVFHMSNILDTGLDRHSLSVLISLCDLGVNPEALAAVIKELRQENPSSSQPSKMGSSVP